MENGVGILGKAMNKQGTKQGELKTNIEYIKNLLFQMNEQKTLSIVGDKWVHKNGRDLESEVHTGESKEEERMD